MIHIVPARQRYFSNFQWLHTYWLFSFADYYDPHNIQFGTLRVFNDDVVQPGTGFPKHPHSEMEILTIVLDGEITHKDSMGNTAIIRAGDVQRMSAGRGLEHSEFNLGKEPVHFYQVWILPQVGGVTPSCEQKSFAPDAWRNRLLPVASGEGASGAVRLNARATVFRSELSEGNAMEYEVREPRKIFVYVTAGLLRINERKLNAGDQARIDLESNLIFKAVRQASFVMLDLPSEQGWGYDRRTLRGAKA